MPLPSPDGHDLSTLRHAPAVHTAANLRQAIFCSCAQSAPHPGPDRRAPLRIWCHICLAICPLILCARAWAWRVRAAALDRNVMRCTIERPRTAPAASTSWAMKSRIACGSYGAFWPGLLGVVRLHSALVAGSRTAARARKRTRSTQKEGGGVIDIVPLSQNTVCTRIAWNSGRESESWLDDDRPRSRFCEFVRWAWFEFAVSAFWLLGDSMATAPT
ncbi:uncharacterized protein C8Q71DRAFT_73979 [Rhodofomes roseus]|uniref:Uncharacterized protein n=1 Tax=Rhodofomes roseus TaxID=34475 RepID=A0ABQ8KF42_9APHY|nr:uncharacterized protein C8Q71DRAFT_73979 [Rhodofomes roseus]KAH9836253.1 hypothetical protein C8Q71DRAFT_73979 [Rhodofomes roseus]